MLVKVYKNLTRNTWSIQDAKTRKVIGYSENIRLKDAKFVVSEKSRQRVIKEGKKYVHAFVVGELVDEWILKESFETVRYNPYISGSFFTDPSQPVSTDWRGIVHLFRDSQSNKLTVRKEVA